MSRVERLYPGVKWGGCCPVVSDYQPIIEDFGKVIVQVDDNNYQGDTRVLLKKGRRYGVLIFGWGSCSGCDALQACKTKKQVDDLIEEMWKSIHWAGPKGMLKWFLEKDWEVEWSFHYDKTKDFINKAITHLGGDPTELISRMNERRKKYE
jgi:hypothetical protein